MQMTMGSQLAEPCQSLEPWTRKKAWESLLAWNMTGITVSPTILLPPPSGTSRMIANLFIYLSFNYDTYIITIKFVLSRYIQSYEPKIFCAIIKPHYIDKFYLQNTPN